MARGIGRGGGIALSTEPPAWDLAHGDLLVSADGRWLVHADSAPFLWLADTAWELLHRLTLDETEHYFARRRAQGFTVVQTVVLAELNGLTEPTPEGLLPFDDLEPDRPNGAYFSKLDHVIAQADRHGLTVALLPTWGDKVQRWWGVGPAIFSPAYREQGMERAKGRAARYGRFLGSRYANARNLVWINGGDRSPGPAERYPDEAGAEVGTEVAAVWRALARGVREGDGGRHLMTYHPNGGRSSALNFHTEDWLDFNMLQSGHSRRSPPNHALIARDRARTPVKPTLDGEPCYEGHPVEMNPELGWFGAGDARRAAYTGFFAGACGHTYGAHGVWQFLAPGRTPISPARTPWRESLALPGAGQLRYLRALLVSRPLTSRRPDPDLITSGEGFALRADDQLLVYLPHREPVALRLGPQFSGVPASWFDPRTGDARTAEGKLGAYGRTFTPPSSDDWVLRLEEK